MWIFQFCEETKSKRKEYEQNRMFQDVCIIKFPWAKFMVHEQVKVHQVRCKVYTKIKGKKKMLAFQLDLTFKNTMEGGKL